MTNDISIKDLVVCIKGAGEMATGVANRLFAANIRKIVMLEIPSPLSVRRAVSFCEAIYEKEKTVEGVTAVRVEHAADFTRIWAEGKIPVMVDPEGRSIVEVGPQVLVDATLAKTNLGTRKADAPLVIGLGPGFEAGRDVHTVVETNRGHNLGRLIFSGSAEPNTGVPGNIGGYTRERVLRSPADGTFRTSRTIGDLVRRGEEVATVSGMPVQAGIDGIVRGLLRSETPVVRDLKIGDIDPRNNPAYCHTISEKARAIGGAVLEAVLRVYNR